MNSFLDTRILPELVHPLLPHLLRPVLPQAEEKGRVVHMAAVEKKKVAVKVLEVCLKVLVMSKGVVAIAWMVQPMEWRMVKCKVNISSLWINSIQLILRFVTDVKSYWHAPVSPLLKLTDWRLNTVVYRRLVRPGITKTDRDLLNDSCIICRYRYHLCLVFHSFTIAGKKLPKHSWKLEKCVPRFSDASFSG